MLTILVSREVNESLWQCKQRKTGRLRESWPAVEGLQGGGPYRTSRQDLAHTPPHWWAPVAADSPSRSRWSSLRILGRNFRAVSKSSWLFELFSRWTCTSEPRPPPWWCTHCSSDARRSTGGRRDAPRRHPPPPPPSAPPPVRNSTPCTPLDTHASLIVAHDGSSNISGFLNVSLLPS